MDGTVATAKFRYIHSHVLKKNGIYIELVCYSCDTCQRELLSMKLSLLIGVREMI